MGKKTKKYPPKKIVLVSRYPAKGVKEMIAMSRAFDRLRGQKISDIDRLKESMLNDKAIPRGAHGGVIRRADIWQGRQLEGKNVEAEDWLSEYGIFHEEAKRAVQTNNGLPERGWKKISRNSYQKWLKSIKNRKGIVRKTLYGDRLGNKNKGGKK